MFKVSIIIPTYNRAHLIGETLNSIVAQTHTNWECIIIDDGSSDNTEEIIGEYIKKDTRFQFYTRPSDKLKGPNSCRNFGFDKAKGNLIQWFDSDDLLVQNAFELYVKEFEKYPKADAVIAKLQLIHMDSKVVIRENTIRSTNLIEDYFTGKVTFYVSGPMWSNKFLLKQKELFSEDLTNLDDWDFNLRMLYSEPEIVFIENPLIKYRVHLNSLSKEIEKLNVFEIKSEIKAREKQLKLIKQNKKANVKVLKQFIVFRYKYFFREAMIQKNEYRYYFLKELFLKELELLDFKGMFSTAFGFVVFQIFNKGYKLLK